MKFLLEDSKRNETSFEIPDELCEADLKWAKKAYENAKSYVDRLFINLWNYALKTYNLCGIDREVKLDKKSKANLMAGLTQESVDIMASYLVDTPLTFKATALPGAGQAGADKAQMTENILFYISDRTKFHTTLRNGLIEGLIVGSVPLKTAFINEGANPTTVMKDGVPEVIESEGYAGATTYFVDPFNVFPDFYPSRSFDGKKRLRHCTERGVCDVDAFRIMFQKLIDSDENTIKKFIPKNFWDVIATSKNGDVCKDDFGWTRMSILEYFNRKCGVEDGFKNSSNRDNATSRNQPNEFGNFGRDPEMTKDLCEWKMTEDKKKIVLTLNGFPMYIGINKKKFISIDIIPFKDTGTVFGLPLAITLRDAEQVATSFQSSFIDNAVASINKANLVNKNLIFNMDQIERGIDAGENIIVDNLPAGADIRNAIAPLERGRPEDFGIVQAMQALSQRRTGVSEYNAGISSRERVATAVASLVESLLRRLSPYLKNAADVVSIIAEKWLALIRDNFSETMNGYILNSENQQQFFEFDPKELSGDFNFTVSTEGMVAVNNEMALKKMVDLFNVIAPTGMSDASEFAKLVLRKGGLPSSLIVKQGVTMPENFNKDNKNPTTDNVSPDARDMGISMNPQINY